MKVLTTLIASVVLTQGTVVPVAMTTVGLAVLATPAEAAKKKNAVNRQRNILERQIRGITEEERQDLITGEIVNFKDNQRSEIRKIKEIDETIRRNLDKIPEYIATKDEIARAHNAVVEADLAVLKRQSELQSAVRAYDKFKTKKPDPSNDSEADSRNRNELRSATITALLALRKAGEAVETARATLENYEKKFVVAPADGSTSILETNRNLRGQQDEIRKKFAPLKPANLASAEQRLKSIRTRQSGLLQNLTVALRQHGGSMERHQNMSDKWRSEVEDQLEQIDNMSRQGYDASGDIGRWLIMMNQFAAFARDDLRKAEQDQQSIKALANTLAEAFRWEPDDPQAVNWLMGYATATKAANARVDAIRETVRKIEGYIAAAGKLEQAHEATVKAWTEADIARSKTAETTQRPQYQQLFLKADNTLRGVAAQQQPQPALGGQYTAAPAQAAYFETHALAGQ